MLLSINDLKVSYGAIKALHGVSLQIERGEIVTLIGSNGAGKTTLLRSISGLLRPTGGEITWSANGGPSPQSEPRDLENNGLVPEMLNLLPPHEIVRRGISHVPEGRQIFANLSVRENLLLGAYQERSSDRIQEGLDRCYSLFPVLKERRQQRGGTLSGGEQQMLAIGRALMARPTLLLLDEPSLGLAPLIVQRIFDIIRDINAAGTTVFLVEQNAHMALRVAHRGYVLQSGRIIMSERAAVLLENADVKKAYLGG
jgi:branched-chain amino acid transport system ATP-binding protein